MESYRKSFLAFMSPGTDVLERTVLGGGEREVSVLWERRLPRTGENETLYGESWPMKEMKEMQAGGRTQECGT